MPKRTGNLLEKIVEEDNICDAYQKTIKGRRYGNSILKYTSNLGDNLVSLQYSLKTLTWKPHISIIKEIKYPKRRIITAPIPYDRVAFHAIVDVISPYFEKKFIYHSYACRLDKGTLKAVKTVQKMMHNTLINKGEVYILKCDISNYFGTIDHVVLKKIIRKTIKDKSVLTLLDSAIDSSSMTPSTFVYLMKSFIHNPYIIKSIKNEVYKENIDERALKALIRLNIKDKETLKFMDRLIFAVCNPNIGLPLGALTSQLFANVYLNELDHYLKEELRVKNYVRYMDDFVIISDDKKYLRTLYNQIDLYLKDKLCLVLNPKTDIFPGYGGVDFCGYRIFHDRLMPRKRNIKVARRRLKRLANKYYKGELSKDKIDASLQSYLGYAKHCKASNTVGYILKDLNL